ncbi:MAG: ribonuclease HI [Bacteroidetes bacterium]|nr:ribonuclease HI [Bacteroidota bacterium]MCX7907174.1 ribonuclease HI [Bacteroidota bacterium]MDW8138755.1 ribonuclease HI [Bacteroidota bacterium]
MVGTPRKTVDVYTDGACLGNPGPGGWAALLRYGEHERELVGAEAETTNNRMELRAAVEALRALKEPCRVRLHTDSAYLHQAFSAGWLDRWRARNWRTQDGKPVKNQDLWQALLEAMRSHEVVWIKVPGHAGDPMNERVDRLARQAAMSLMTSLEER